MRCIFKVSSWHNYSLFVVRLCKYAMLCSLYACVCGCMSFKSAIYSCCCCFCYRVMLKRCRFSHTRLSCVWESVSQCQRHWGIRITNEWMAKGSRTRYSMSFLGVNFSSPIRWRNMLIYKMLVILYFGYWSKSITLIQ